MDLSGLAITDAVPLDDGGLSTTLVDANGNQVATITRLADGSATADVTDSGAGFDLSSIFGKVTGFLDSVAKAAKQTSDEATRISNAARGAATGAQTGYNLPTDLKPWLIGGAVLVGVLLLTRGDS